MLKGEFPTIFFHPLLSCYLLKRLHLLWMSYILLIVASENASLRDIGRNEVERIHSNNALQLENPVSTYYQVEPRSKCGLTSPETQNGALKAERDPRLRSSPSRFIGPKPFEDHIISLISPF